MFLTIVGSKFNSKCSGRKTLADSCGKFQCYGLSVCKRLDKYSNVNIPALSNEIKISKCFLRGREKASKFQKAYVQASNNIF